MNLLWRLLLLDVLLDDAERRAATRCGEIAGRPEGALPIAPHQSRMPLAHESAGDALEAVHQSRHGYLGRVVHQQMNMIVPAVHLDHLRLEIGADRGEDLAHVVPHRLGEHMATVFGYEDQMDVERKDAVPTAPKIGFSRHRPMLRYRDDRAQGRFVPLLPNA